jgi:hypothetical protein
VRDGFERVDIGSMLEKQSQDISAAAQDRVAQRTGRVGTVLQKQSSELYIPVIDRLI